jgi:hypothetical protein
MRKIMRAGSHFVRRHLISALIGLAGFGAATPAMAVYDPSHQFVVNGGFEQTTNGVGELVYNTNAVGWTSSPASNGDYGYNFVFNPATASTTGVRNQYGEDMTLWGPGNGVANGLSASPTGGNFLAADGAYNNGQISQALTGLIVGQTYSLSFNFAGAQQSGYTGATTEAWYYGLSSQGTSQETAVLNNASHGFTGWQSQTYNFVASQASDTLYFLAAGTPSGQPPFVLLDSVSLTGGFVSAAPDPATWMLLIAGFGAVGLLMRRRGSGQQAPARLSVAA